VHDHRHGVPAQDALDPALEVVVTRALRFSSIAMVLTYGVLAENGILAPAWRARSISDSSR
jgi:hypothetical protein